MKKKDGFKNGNILSFRALADKVKKITDAEDIGKLMKSGAVEAFLKGFEEELSKPCEPVSESEIYEGLTENYLLLISSLGIENFSFFRFADYDDCRVIVIDGKEYDLDGAFSHNDQKETEALCAIDCLIGDLPYDYREVLKSVERMINIKGDF